MRWYNNTVNLSTMGNESFTLLSDGWLLNRQKTRVISLNKSHTFHADFFVTCDRNDTWSNPVIARKKMIAWALSAPIFFHRFYQLQRVFYCSLYQNQSIADELYQWGEWKPICLVRERRYQQFSCLPSHYYMVKQMKDQRLDHLILTRFQKHKLVGK